MSDINVAIERLFRALESYPGFIEKKDAEGLLGILGLRAWTYMDPDLGTCIQDLGWVYFCDMVVYLDNRIVGTINIHGGVTARLRIPPERQAEILQAIAGFYN